MHFAMKAIISTLVAASCVGASPARKPILQSTPPMGFNNWARFQCGLNESLFISTAEAMISTGLQKAGYNRLNLDDCWPLHDRTSNGSLQWDPVLFPHGLPWLAKWMNERGFNLGIYSDAGNLTCGGYPGSFGYEEIDAQTFASWGIDYLKLDGCNMPDPSEAGYKAVYGKWHKILSGMSEPLIFSESAPAYFAESDNLTDWYRVMNWVPRYGQLARHSRDVVVYNSSSYEYEANVTGWDSIMFNYGEEVRVARYQRPGYFNDPDFLNVDHPNNTIDEKRSHFALWASLSAPLIISAYISALRAEDIAFLTNSDLIAVNQDALGLQATLVSQNGTWDVLTKDLSNGDRLLTILNRGNYTANLTVPFSHIGFTSPHAAKYRVKDLWTGTSTHTSQNITALNIPSHGTAIYRISSLRVPIETIPTGMIFNTQTLHCLTSHLDSSVTFSDCQGSDAQIWRVDTYGRIANLASPEKILTANGDGSVSVEAFEIVGRSGQLWTYYLTGLLSVRDGSGSLGGKSCLAEGSGGGVLVTTCKGQVNEQVFALPSGVEVLDG